MIAILDNSSTHHGEPLAEVQRRHPRLHVEYFPAYAPELNPDELVWAHFKATLANGHPNNLDELLATLCRITKDVCHRPALIRAFIAGSELPSFL